MILIVASVIVALIYLRKILYELWEDSGTFWVTMATTIPSILNAVQIIFFNAIYSSLAYILTNYENHRTQSSYERALILKTFIFQFLNSYSLLFYIAFFKQSITGCIENSVRSEDNLCTTELANQMRSIMIIAIFKNLMELGIPCITTMIKSFKRGRLFNPDNVHGNDAKLLVRIEEQMTKGAYAYKEIDGTYYDYLEIMLQMGYVCYFSVSFPLAPILAFINNLFEMQVDRQKLI